MVSRLKTLFTLLLCAWSIGISLRIMTEYICNQFVLFMVNRYDFVFDWSLLFIFGIITLILTLFEKNIKNTDNYRNQKVTDN